MKAKVNEIDIAYSDEGTGLPVVFIHAFPLNRAMWDDQADALKGRCRVIRLDLRGFGDSDVPQGPYFMNQMASDVKELMARLSIDRAVLVGLSMGGYVSLAFYRDYPEAVRAMVLADTRAAADNEQGRERRMKSAERAEREGASAIADDMETVALAPATVASRPDVVRRMRSIAESNSPRGIASAQRGMAERLDSTDLLSSIACPVLVIVGSQDALTPVAEAEKLRDKIPDSRMVVIEGAGHLSNLERPEEFNAALLSFIEEIENR